MKVLISYEIKSPPLNQVVVMFVSESVSVRMKEEASTTELHISVRNLVEFIFREGDIDNRSATMIQNAMMEGSRIHRKIQRSMGKDYEAEVPLKLSIDMEDYILTVEGRADGIMYLQEIDKMTDEYEQTTLELEEPKTKWEEIGTRALSGHMYYVDEIKGIYRNVTMMEHPIYVHKAQAMCYAYIYALQKHLDEIGIQMTYCNLDTEEIRYFREEFTWDALAEWFDKLIAEYRKWSDFQVEWKKKRQNSIKNLEFPFLYREGQKKLVTDVYRTICRQKTLFIQAPTGVGKTISTIFPAVKAVGEDFADRIFYLTAKTITASVAKETFQLLYNQGYAAKTIQLTAKEKLCLCEEMECNPLHCPYAKGHFNRVNDAVYDLLQQSDMFTREEILEQAKSYQVCPFEMSLDVATYADNILCDYNYVFDPNVYLKRFFQEGTKGDYIFLVDEAHNLVDRSREMYSASIVKEDVLAVKRIMKHQHRGIERTLDKCNKELLALKRECESYRVYDNLGMLMFHFMRLASQLEEFFEKPHEFADKKTVLDFYFELRHFMNIYDLVDEHYVIYSQIDENNCFSIKLFCVDPSANLQKCIDKANATIYFSATLLPVTYYKQLLSTKEDNYAVYAQSTFKESQRLLLFGKNVSTKYTRRCREEYEKIVQYILALVEAKEGNYMAFFPSYKLMQEVVEILEECAPWLRICMQHANMKEHEREVFLTEFEQVGNGTLLACCVMGGIFGEGIDLKNDRLIAAIIVGTGLPQISNEREILKNYYDNTGVSGFDYAFRYPGMNKVLQAAGRVIRTNEDRGIILLLDERFLQADYESLYPREWEMRKVCDVNQVRQQAEKFWLNAGQEL